MFKLGGPPSTKCVLCDKTVYPAELIKMESKEFHKECLKCTECKKHITGQNYGGLTPENVAYCKIHWDRMVASLGGNTTKISGTQSKWTK